MKKLILGLLCFVFAQSAFAIYTLEPRDCKFFTANAISNTTLYSTDASAFNKPMDFQRYRSASFHVHWASLVGSGASIGFNVQVSNDGTNWVAKTGATSTSSGASGSDMISLTNVTEKFYRVQAVPTNVTSGTITGECGAKEY